MKLKLKMHCSMTSNKLTVVMMQMSLIIKNNVILLMVSDTNNNFLSQIVMRLLCIVIDQIAVLRCSLIQMCKIRQVLLH